VLPEAMAARRASSNFETLVVSPASVTRTMARRAAGRRRFKVCEPRTTGVVN